MRKQIYLYILIFLCIFSPLSANQIQYSKMKLSKSMNNNRSALQKKIFGWIPGSSLSNLNSIRFDLLTDVSFFPDDAISDDGSLNGIEKRILSSNLIQMAHLNNVNVILTIPLLKESEVGTFLSSLENQNNLFNNIRDLLKTTDFDGINLDFENIPENNKNDYNGFVKKLYDKFKMSKSNFTISLELPAWSGKKSYDIRNLQNNCDYFVLMGYDYHYKGDEVAGPNAPLPLSTKWDLNITKSINYYESVGINNTKLLLAVPYYGFLWQTESGSLGSKIKGDVKSKEIYYKTFRNNYLTRYKRLWDDHSLTPWFSYQDTEGRWFQGWYEDEISLVHKYKYLKEKNLLGIGIFQVGNDDGFNELWGAIEKEFSAMDTNIEGAEIFSFEINKNINKGSLSFNIPVEDKVRISLHDKSGKEVILITDELHQKGYNLVEFETLKLTQNEYFCKMIYRTYTKAKYYKFN